MFNPPYPAGNAAYPATGPYANPDGIIPRPPPTGLGAAAWDGPGVRMNWASTAAANLLYQVPWSSPIFDLRPDLGSIAQNRTDRAPSAIPIWSSQGRNTGVRLFLQVFDMIDMRGIQIMFRERAHVSDVARLTSITDYEDITAQFTTQGQSALLQVMPFGDGYPVRYWQSQFLFNIQDDSDFPAGGTPIDFTIYASLY